MHQSWDHHNQIVSQEFVSASSPERLQSALRDRYNRDMSNPNVTRVVQQKIGRNDPCPCNSGKKFKKCCISLVQEAT